ncbi:hypothetical protein Sar04_39180 [Salinispora arenicola]|uniref:Uncharacterized protein n=1 Tax=Salinispora arenicola TaxID=168697 RepID=A0ABQ4JZ27_SALAC|nr:hypothetical protein Sar04_39180 [Salinispora arenicola]
MTMLTVIWSIDGQGPEERWHDRAAHHLASSLLVGVEPGVGKADDLVGGEQLQDANGVGAENLIHAGHSRLDHRDKEAGADSRLDRDGALRRALRDDGVCCFDWPTSA